MRTNEGHFSSFDEEDIFFQTWPVDNPKAIILGAHGLAEHSGCYESLAQALAQGGYQLAMYDQRGHGRSGGKRGVGLIDDFVLDMKIFVQKVCAQYPNLPFYIFGHSMGALVAIKYLLRNGLGNGRGVVLSSPFLGVNVPIPAWKKKSAKFVATVLPQVTLFNEIDQNFLTHDQKVLKAYEKDNLRHDRISAALYMSMLDSLEFVFKNPDKMPHPVYFQIAGEDRVVSRQDTEQFFKLIPDKKKTLKIYPNFYHEIYREVECAEPFRDLISWLKENS